MSKSPARRYQTAAQLAADLRRFLAGDPITAKLTRAPGNNEPVGGLKVTTDFAWFAARPSGTEDIYKIYAESWKGEAHLQVVMREAQDVVTAALESEA